MDRYPRHPGTLLHAREEIRGRSQGQEKIRGLPVAGKRGESRHHRSQEVRTLSYRVTGAGERVWNHLEREVRLFHQWPADLRI